MLSLESLLVPFWMLQVIAFCFGVIIGSFLNVYIYRFHTGKSLGGGSHCLSCGISLRWYELFPLVSYVLLRGKCRNCGCRIPARYFLVELLTGVLYVCSLILTVDLIELLLWWVVLAILVVITVYDLYHYIIPDELTLALTAVSIGLLVYQLGFTTTLLSQYGVVVLAALCGSAFYYFLWAISRGQWLGFGDVKLAFPLGLLVGPGFVFSFVVLSFWVGAIISLLILAWQHIRRGQARLQLGSSQLTIKSAVPFAPFLVLSCVTIIFTSFNVLSLFSF
jgi:leader peptidase (prepilin peptidase)/N-methyltransferase